MIGVLPATTAFTNLLWHVLSESFISQNGHICCHIVSYTCVSFIIPRIDGRQKFFPAFYGGYLPSHLLTTTTGYVLLCMCFYSRQNCDGVLLLSAVHSQTWIALAGLRFLWRWLLSFWSCRLLLATNLFTSFITEWEATTTLVDSSTVVRFRSCYFCCRQQSSWS